MAEIQFFADTNHIQHLAGSGMGFYGSNFATSVAVGSYQDSTYVTDATGTSQGPQSNNFKWLNTASGTLNGASSGLPLTGVPNFQATLNPRFLHGSAVKTDNVRLYIYDRVNLNNLPSGVTCKVAEFVHPSLTQVNNGSGSTLWQTPAGSSYMSLTSSPGMSGFRPNGANTSADRHDWYLGMSASPNSVGTKTQFGMAISLEYY
jgi:hypothetical protein